MKVITEIELRDMYKKQPFDCYILEHPDKLTPAAYQFLSERRIAITEINHKSIDKPSLNDKKEKQSREVKEPETGYLIMDTGRQVAEKPEEYTHLKGRNLVLKNHKRIKFRGKLDSLQGFLISLIIEIESSGHKTLSEDMSKILDYLRKILRAEVLEEQLELITFNGWNDAEIRDRSHHPDKYFGIKHFMPDPKFGKLMAALNQLRTQVRELEILAVDAFVIEEENRVERQDILLALNRLSSIVYIVMCQFLGGIYKI